MYTRRHWTRVISTLAILSTMGSASCDCATDREECASDSDCGEGAVCYHDDLCIWAGVARRLGAEVGEECVASRGVTFGCAEGVLCRMGFCQLPVVGPEDGAVDAPDASVLDGAVDGAIDAEPPIAVCTETGSPTDGVPLFGGATQAVSDGADAVIVRWIAAADVETLPENIVYLVYVSTMSGMFDYAAPVGTVVGDTSFRVTGLLEGTTYYFVVRARDEAEQVDCNENEVSATPMEIGGCIDYATQVQPIFAASCISCHSGDTAPRELHLDSYDGVMAGGLTGFEVVACQADSSLLIQKITLDSPPIGERMPLRGPYLASSEVETIRLWIEQGAARACPDDPSACSDTTPPTFGGLASATLTGMGARLCWMAGSDDTTRTADLEYDVYQATSSGGQAFAAPPTDSSTPGSTCLDVTGLTPGQEYCWVVRARDGAGNRDSNVVERCLTVPAASCIDYAAVVQPIFDAECVHCHSGALAPRGLSLDSYAGVIAGGATGGTIVACRSISSLLYLKISSASPPVGARMPADGPPYLTAAQIASIEQWVDEGARASCAAPDPCSDSMPPTFAGIASATATSAGTVDVCWMPGRDDLTPRANLLYDVYEASTAGGEDFGAAPRTTSAAGATCVTVTALSPGGTECFVVRARDQAGNQDGNTVERCVTMPSVPAGCVDYATLIQPVFDRNCARCHSGTAPPQWLRLDGYDNVMAGSARRNTVVACDSASSLLVDKVSAAPSIGDRMPRDGPPYLTASQIAMLRQWIDQGAQRTCAEAASCGDTTAPTFGGARSATATDSTTVRVCWLAATDDATAGPDIRYDVYDAPRSGAHSFSQPPQYTVSGVTCTDVRVGPGSTTCYVVRARDRADNRDGNTREVCATTPAASCAVDYDSLVQPILTARCTHCHDGDAGAPRFLDLTSYGGAIAGGAIRNEVLACDWTGSLLNRKTSASACGDRMPADGPPWLSASERSRLEAWIGSGARRSCTESDPCIDSTAPTFVGVRATRVTSPTTVEVCWDPATDATTSADAIVYQVYDASSPGGETFLRPAPYAVSGGATCLDVTVAAGERSCFVVRARDLAGNTDTNTRESCSTTGGACFDYDEVIQPIFDARCVHCHSGPSAPRGLRWDSYANAIRDDGAVRPCRADGSDLIDETSACRMPEDTSGGSCRACLTSSQVRLLTQWVDGGANRRCPWGGC